MAGSGSFEDERRDQPAELSASGGAGFLGRIRTRSKSRDRDSSDRDSASTRSNSLLSRMTSASSPAGEAHQAHHGGALDKIKGVFNNRPSSRDRFSGREEGSERGSLSTVQTNGTTREFEALSFCRLPRLDRERLDG